MTDQPKQTFLDLILAHCEHPELPEGWDTWGWKIVRPDLRTYHGFRWPWPGNTVTDPTAQPSASPCPSEYTGGYCIALDWRGARSGGYGGTTALLLAYRQADILARSDADGKLRVRSAYVADVIDVHRLVRHAAAGANLAGAYLAGANLAGADLAGADLTGAYLTDADLTGAYLTGANLTRAYLTGAYLMDAYLTGADLTGADLTGAYLTGAYLTGADLTRALHKDQAIGLPA